MLQSNAIMKKLKMRQVSIKQDKQQLASLLFMIIALIALSLSLFVYQASKPKVYKYGVYASGTPITAGAVSVVINKVTYNAGQNGFVVPTGKQYIVIDATVSNASNKALFISPSTQTYIKDNDGRVYYLTPSGLEDPFKAGDLIAGDKISGELSYMVSKDKTYTLYIDAIWSGGVVSVRLN